MAISVTCKEVKCVNRMSNKNGLEVVERVQPSKVETIGMMQFTSSNIE